MLSVWHHGQEGNPAGNEWFQRHLPRVDDYLWLAEDGLKMQGYNGSQCWDTSFAVQAITEGKLEEQFPACTRRVYSYLERTQISQDEVNRDYFFRHISKGSTVVHLLYVLHHL